MLEARTYSVSIPRDWRDLYEGIWRPDFFAEWASGLAEADLHEEGGAWVAKGPDGPITIRFTPHNDHGVMDHYVGTADGGEVHIPLRVVQNGDGAEVMLTLYRQPDFTDEKFAGDAKWIMKDLRALKERVAR